MFFEDVGERGDRSDNLGLERARGDGLRLRKVQVGGEVVVGGAQRLVRVGVRDMALGGEWSGEVLRRGLDSEE